MDRFKRILLRFVLTVSLLLGTGFAGDRSARAQFGVIDPANIATSIVNSIREVAQMASQLGVAIDQLDWLDDIMDLAGRLQTVLDDIGTLRYMYNSLLYQTEMLKNYGQMLLNMEQQGINPSIILQLRGQLETGYNTVKDMIEQGMKLLSDTGIPLADKLKFAQEYAQNVADESIARAEQIEADVDMIEGVWGLIEFDNLLAGEPANAGLSGMGSVTVQDYIHDTEPESSTSMEEAFGSDVSEVKRTGAMGGKTVMLILGFLLSFSLIGIMIRFMRGDPRSEAGFMRVFVVIVAAAVLMTVLNAVLRI